MDRQQIDTLVKEMNVDTATRPVDQRVQQIVVRLVADLFQAIEDLDIQPSECGKVWNILPMQAKPMNLVYLQQVWV